MKDNFCGDENDLALLIVVHSMYYRVTVGAAASDRGRPQPLPRLLASGFSLNHLRFRCRLSSVHRMARLPVLFFKWKPRPSLQPRSGLRRAVAAGLTRLLWLMPRLTPPPSPKAPPQLRLQATSRARWYIAQSVRCMAFKAFLFSWKSLSLSPTSSSARCSGYK